MHFDIPHSYSEATSRFLPPSRFERVSLALLALATLGMFVTAWLFSAPSQFPEHSLITIPQDATAPEFAHTLKTAGVVRSETLFRILARVSMLDHHLDPGTYAFMGPINLTAVVSRVGNAQHGIEPVRVTFTEGMTTFDIAETLASGLPGFDENAFLAAASTSEGYLFPDTYFFMPGDQPDDIVVRLRSQFSESIATITPQIMASKRSFSDIVIMASILEREARGLEDMRMVAGILWNRIDEDHALQVDATFGYIHQENGYTPTAADLDSDSPFNTYRNRGLPPTAISNPGLDALIAALTPISTDNFYYLTGRDGEMHYAKTFEEHKRNRVLYLD